MRSCRQPSWISPYPPTNPPSPHNIPNRRPRGHGRHQQRRLHRPLHHQPRPLGRFTNYHLWVRPLVLPPLVFPSLLAHHSLNTSYTPSAALSLLALLLYAIFLVLYIVRLLRPPCLRLHVAAGGVGDGKTISTRPFTILAIATIVFEIVGYAFRIQSASPRSFVGVSHNLSSIVHFPLPLGIPSG